MRSSSARRPWYARARTLFSSLSELRTRRKQPARSRLGVLALEDRVYPSITPLAEFQPATYRTNDQTNPTVAADSAGNFVVTWQGPGHGVDSSGAAIYGQRYDNLGRTIGNEFPVNEHVTAYDQTYPAVAIAPDGSFVVTYTSVDPTFGTSQIFYRRFDADAVPLGDERPVHANLAENQIASSVAFAADGSFVVAYQHNLDATLGWDVSAQRFDNQGSADGNLVDAYPPHNPSAADEHWASLAVQPDGSFVLGWSAPDTASNGVWARRFDGAGHSLGDPQRLNAVYKNDQQMWLSGMAPRPDGGFVATWMSWGENTSYETVARIFAADGSAVTGDLTASEPTIEFQGYATVSVDPSGGFLVTWEDSGKDGSSWGIYAQQFAANGTKVGIETRLNSTTLYGQMYPRVAADGQGDFIAVWTSEGYDVSGLGVVASRIKQGQGPTVGAGFDQVETDEDTPVTIHQLTYNDIAAGPASLSVSAVTQPLHGTTVLNTDGTVLYTPSANWNGTDGFSYTLSDGNGHTDAVDVAVAVAPVNDAPVAAAQSMTTSEDTALAVTLSGSDVEGDPLTFWIVDAPLHGTLSDLDADGRLTYVPDGNYNGTDSFTYLASDGIQDSETATVTIGVNAVADGPGVTITPSGGSTHVAEWSPFTDGDPETDTYTVVLNTQPTADVTVTLNPGSQLTVSPTILTFTSQNWSTPQAATVAAVDDDTAEADPHTGVVSHTVSSADPVYNGIAAPSLTVSISDGDFAWVADELPDPFSVNEQGATSATYNIVLTSQPTATVTVSLTAPAGLTLSVSSLTFTTANWDTPQAVTVTAVDDAVTQGYREPAVSHTASSADPIYNGLQNDVVVPILDNDAPNALPDEFELDEETPTTFDLIANDYDALGYPMTVTNVTQPDYGSVVLNANGTVTFTPPPDWSGETTIDYTTSDGHGTSNVQSATFRTNPINHAPTLRSIADRTSAEDQFVDFQVSVSDIDGDDGFLYGAANLPDGLVIEPMTGRIWGWVGPKAAGTYSVMVTVDDFNGGVSARWFTWTVTDTNHAPRIWPIEDRFIAMDSFTPNGITSTSVEIDGDAVHFTYTGLPPGLTYNPAGLGSVDGWPTTPGDYNVTVTVEDSNNASDSVTGVWRVYEHYADLPPMLTVDNGYPGTPLLHGSNMPVDLQVNMWYPSHPEEYVYAGLSVEGGGASVSSSAVMLKHGESAIVHLTPGSVSQRIWDSTLKCTIDGMSMRVAALTTVGVEMPGHVRALNTPDQMGDRISLGDGNWGSFRGAARVVPNLMDQHGVDFRVQRPAENDAFGNAFVNPLDNARLRIATRSVLAVVGTAQTRPNEDGQPAAAQLRLVAQLAQGIGEVATQLGTYLFRILAKPDRVTALRAYPLNADVTDGDDRWVVSFGAMYDLSVDSDSGNPADLRDVSICELVSTLPSTGLFKFSGITVQKKWEGPGGWEKKDLVDKNSFTLAYKKSRFTAQEALETGKQEMHQLIRSQPGSYLMLQNMRFWHAALGEPPMRMTARGEKVANPSAAPPIKYSGYAVVYKAYAVGDRQAMAKQELLFDVKRWPFGVGDAKAGLTRPAARRVVRVIT